MILKQKSDENGHLPGNFHSVLDLKSMPFLSAFLFLAGLQGLLTP